MENSKFHSSARFSSKTIIYWPKILQWKTVAPCNLCLFNYVKVLCILHLSVCTLCL